jgi:hypothetical protein
MGQSVAVIIIIVELAELNILLVVVVHEGDALYLLRLTFPVNELKPSASSEGRNDAFFIMLSRYFDSLREVEYCIFKGSVKTRRLMVLIEQRALRIV